MKYVNAYVGDIRICTKYDDHNSVTSKSYMGNECIGWESFGCIEFESQVIKENAILIKLECGGYVDLDNLNTALDYLKVYKDKRKNGFKPSTMIMSNSPSSVAYVFVDEQSLTPYYSLTQDKKAPVHKLKKLIKPTI